LCHKANNFAAQSKSEKRSEKFSKCLKMWAGGQMIRDYRPNKSQPIA
jgi:hypothetical protein